MSLATQFVIQVQNERGALAALCTELGKVAVNIAAIQAPDHPGRAAVRIVATPVDAAKKVLEKMGYAYSEETVVTAHLPERPGALGKLTRKLTEKGIDILYCYGTIERGTARAMVVLGVSDPQTAAEIVK
ncbi:MAG: hypothetical protein HY648_11220 [Acidobacteria bacterium]|nr:hypothetical protein [Acidobacteriota bacterium]